MRGPHRRSQGNTICCLLFLTRPGSVWTRASKHRPCRGLYTKGRQILSSVFQALPSGSNTLDEGPWTGFPVPVLVTGCEGETFVMALFHRAFGRLAERKRVLVAAYAAHEACNSVECGTLCGDLKRFTTRYIDPKVCMSTSAGNKVMK